MARTRQKSKQRKAKRLEEERKAAGRTEGPQQAERPRRTSESAPPAAPMPALAEVEEARQEAAVEVDEAREEAVAEVEEAREEAALEAQEATRAAEVATAPEVAPVPTPEPPARKLRRRERREAEVKEVKEPRRGKPAARPAKPAPRAAKAAKKSERRSRGRVVTFLVQVWAELRRVQWPDRTQVTQATAVVVVFCFIAGGYLAIWDWVFGELIKVIL